jgi:hypothetical protein
MRCCSTMFGFLMRHTSTWMVWLIKKMWDFGRQEINLWLMRRWIMTEDYSVVGHLKSWTARANFLWRASKQWALFKHVVQYFCASPSCHRFAITLTQWSMQDGTRPHTTNNVLDFLHDIFDSNVISNWLPRMWTELAPAWSWFKPMWLLFLAIPEPFICGKDVIYGYHRHLTPCTPSLCILSVPETSYHVTFPHSSLYLTRRKEKVFGP